MQNAERFFCTTMPVKSPHKRFAAVTYVWSRDLIGIFLQGKVIREVRRVHPGGMSQNIIEVQNLSQTVTQQSWQGDAVGLHASDHALSRFCAFSSV